MNQIKVFKSRSELVRNSFMKPFKLSFFTCVALVGLLNITEYATAQFSSGQRGFYCHQNRPIPNSDGQTTVAPTTIYQSVNGNHEPWIQWETNYFSGSGYDPLSRCDEVSKRLEALRQAEELNFIYFGKMNRQWVICTLKSKEDEFKLEEERCDKLIYTLEPKETEDAARIHASTKLDTLRDVLEGRASFQEALLYESTQVPLIDVRPYIEYDE